MTKILVVAGEASGDLHAGNVILELKRLKPDLQIIGTGGKVLASAGAHLYYRVEELAVIGFMEVLKNYGYYKGIFDQMVSKLEQERPDAVFLVDYVAFNLRFAEEAKKRGIKVIYYVAPQVWAWKKNRIKKIKKYVDELIVLFPFEVGFFQREGMKTHCFGHPLLDIVKPSLSREEVIRKWKLDAKKKIICLLPGSRKNEIHKHLPLLFDTVMLLNKRRNDLQFVYSLASTVEKEVIYPFLKKCKADIIIAEDDTYNVVAHSDFALVASGTATLETAILQTPLIIFYKSSLITYLIGKYILRIKAIGLPNIVAGKKVVLEDPHFSSPKKMVEDMLHYLDNPADCKELKYNLAQVKNELGGQGAYRKAAEFINTLL